MGSQNQKKNKNIRNEVYNTRLDNKMDLEIHEKLKICNIAEEMVI
jgi:hypothetical protein